MSSAQQKVSFTVRRPSPVSRGISPGDSDSNSRFKVPSLPKHLSDDSNPVGSPLARSATSSPRPAPQYTYHDDEDDDSSSAEDDAVQDELVTGFDRFGVQRANGNHKKVKEGPLVIPALKNKDWREVARKRRGGNQFVPESGKAGVGADGSVGGLGTRDSINSGPVLSGLQRRKREETLTIKGEDEDVKMEEVVKIEKVEETEDQIALRALLSEANGGGQDGYHVDIIPTPVSEADAFKQDIDELPEVATLADYERIPVSQFGAAMLRGMGWKEGTAASRKPGKGIVEPYIPAPRPALLGIGAKEQEVLDDGSKRKGNKSKKPERRYMPVVKQEREDSHSNRSSRDRSRSPKRSSAAQSRHASRSPDRRDKSRNDREEESKRKRERDYDSSKSRGKDRDRERDYRRDSERGKDQDRRRDYDRDRSHSRKEDSRESGRRRDY